MHNFDEEVIFCLERQIIPAWEHYGTERLAVNTPSLAEFLAQPLPEEIEAWEKEESTPAPRAKLPYRESRVLKSWLEEDQISIRYPDLIYVRSGVAEFRFGDYVVRCPQGHFLLLSPVVARPAGERPHLEEPAEGKECEVWWFNSFGERNYIALSVCYSAGKEHVNSGEYYVVTDPHLSRVFQAFVREVSQRVEGYKKTGAATLQSFLIMLLREIKEGRFYNRGVDNLPKSAQRKESTIEMAKHYINQNLNHPLTIDTVAQVVFMTRTHFIREFKKETGQTFREYLTERRLEEALYWLSHDHHSIGAVSHYIGLKSSRFHQLFLERFGTTPAEYRKQAARARLKKKKG